MSDIKSDAKSESTSLLAIVVHFFWTIVGNAVLAISTLLIFQNRDTFFSVADVVYLVTVPLLVGARYLDVAYYKGTTAYGDPSTMAHWRLYSLKIILLSVAVWSAAHGLAYALAR